MQIPGINVEMENDTMENVQNGKWSDETENGRYKSEASICLSRVFVPMAVDGCGLAIR